MERKMRIRLRRRAPLRQNHLPSQLFFTIYHYVGILHKNIHGNEETHEKDATRGKRSARYLEIRTGNDGSLPIDLFNPSGQNSKLVRHIDPPLPKKHTRN